MLSYGNFVVEQPQKLHTPFVLMSVVFCVLSDPQVATQRSSTSVTWPDNESRV